MKCSRLPGEDITLTFFDEMPAFMVAKLLK